MTQDQNGPIAPLISDVIGGRIRDLRESAGMSRDDLAAAAADAGAPAGLTGTVIRFLETGRPGRDGIRTRHFTLDELTALAAGLEVTPLELLGDQAVLFVGDTRRPADCPTCAAAAGEMTRVVRADVDKLGEDLGDLEPTLIATALRLAGAIDSATGDAATRLHLLTRELRATVEQLLIARRGVEPDDDDEDDFDDLDAPE